MEWEILKKQYLLQTWWLSVRKDCVKMHSGVVIEDYYVLEYSDWVNVIVITKEGKFVLERQYRHGTQSVDYENYVKVQLRKMRNRYKLLKENYGEKLAIQAAIGICFVYLLPILRR